MVSLRSRLAQVKAAKERREALALRFFLKPKTVVTSSGSSGWGSDCIVSALTSWGAAGCAKKKASKKKPTEGA